MNNIVETTDSFVFQSISKKNFQIHLSITIIPIQNVFIKV